MNTDPRDFIPPEGDLRLHHLIQPWNGQEADIGLIGVPFDRGIKASGGRTGAAQGPDAIRDAINRFGTTYFAEYDLDFSHLKIVDFGNIEVSANTEETHRRVTTAVTSVLEKGILPVILGGGNDISFANIRALTQTHDNPIGGINFDAHFDVRPVINDVIKSGCPFWMALEKLNGRFDGKRFVEMGIAGNANAKIHHEYLKEKGARIVPLSEIESSAPKMLAQSVLETIGETAFLSVDIDVVQQAFAPGCSAPAPIGMTPRQLTELVFHLAQSSAIQWFDIMEVSPPYDPDGRTARLAASVISHFLAGYALRTTNSATIFHL